MSAHAMAPTIAAQLREARATGWTVRPSGEGFRAVDPDGRRVGMERPSRARAWAEVLRLRLARIREARAMERAQARGLRS